MTMPEDFTNGVKEMIDGDGGASSDPYDSLVPLGQRKVSEIKLNAGGGGKSEAEMYAELGYSRPIAQVSNLTRKLYGFMRDGNVESHLERSAVKAAMSLHDFIFDAPCVNRAGRFDEEEGRAREWLRLIEQNPETYKEEDEDSPFDNEFGHLEALLKKWGKADAWMLQARIVEEQQGLDAAEKLYAEYTVRKQEREEVLMEAAELPPAFNMLFWCRVRQYKIMRERAYDLAMGYPTHDFTEVKQEIADGADISDIVHKMTWPFREAYLLLFGSMMDGHAHRELLMAMIAQQLPAPPQQFPPGYWPGQPPQEEPDGEEPEDGRKAIFGMKFGGAKQEQQQKQKQQQRKTGRARRRNR